MMLGRKRVNKILKIGRKYLNWIQNSVLEGELTPATFESLKHEVRKVIKDDHDSVIFYIWRTEHYTSRGNHGLGKGSKRNFYLGVSTSIKQKTWRIDITK